MKDETKKQLEAILGAYDVKLAEVARVAEALRAAQAAFPARFAAARTKTIRPAIQEFADLLNGQGHEASVNEHEESSGAVGGVGGVTSAGITLRIVPKPFAHNAADKTRRVSIEIAFAANRNERKIVVSSSNTMINSGGSLGKRGEYEVDAMTPEVIAHHVIQTVQEAFAGTR
jgi:hypothetical protein